MDIKKLQLLSQAEELFNLQNAYNKFMECQNYYSTIPVCAVEEIQKHLDKITALEADLNENSQNDILLIHASNITAMKFFFAGHLSVFTSRVFRFDEKANETKIGESLMEDIREFLPKVKDSFENDHILHLKLSYIYCEIRLVNLNLEENMEKIDELFSQAKIWREKCGRTKECMYFKALLGNLYTHLSFRAGRMQDAYLMACQIWDDFSENDDVKALKYDRGISLELAQVCQFHFEKAGVDNDTAVGIYYRKKALWYYKNALGKTKTFEAKCRINQQLAVKSLREENEGVLGCLMARPHREAIKNMNKSHLGWRKMIRESENNLKHLRYLGHLVYHNYLKYQIKSDLKYFKNMEAIFAELSFKILGSPEIDNLEIIEAMLRMTCRMNSFPSALEICSNSKKIRDHNKLLHPFGAILKLVEQISVLKTSPFKIDSNMKLSDTNNVFEAAILQLKDPKHPLCSFWYDFGVNVYFDFLQKLGQSSRYQQMWKFANKIQHFSLQTLASWQSINSASSTESVTENVEVPISDMAFNFFVFAETSVLPAILSSSDSLMRGIASLFNVPSERFTFFTSEKLLFRELNQEHLWSDAEAQLVLLVQVSDRKEDVKSVEEIKEWVLMNTRATKFSWVICKTFFFCNEHDPESQGLSDIDYAPNHKDGREMIVTSSSTKLERTKFDSTPNQKYLPDALAQVLREEAARLINEDRIRTSRNGETSVCVQQLCEKMREDCLLNSNCYLSAKPADEILNTKKLLITLPTSIAG